MNPSNISTQFAAELEEGRAPTFEAHNEKHPSPLGGTDTSISGTTLTSPQQLQFRKSSIESTLSNRAQST